MDAKSGLNPSFRLLMVMAVYTMLHTMWQLRHAKLKVHDCALSLNWKLLVLKELDVATTQTRSGLVNPATKAMTADALIRTMVLPILMATLVLNIMNTPTGVVDMTMMTSFLRKCAVCVVVVMEAMLKAVFSLSPITSVPVTWSSSRAMPHTLLSKATHGWI
jgi:hypothetical protein